MMFKKISIVILYLLLLPLLFGDNFSRGSNTIGGNLGYYKDFNANISIFHISPKIGYFFTENFMFELGFSYININNNNYNANTYDGYYIDGEQNTISYGAKLFVKKIYFGFEFVQGVIYNMRSSLGNEFDYGIKKFDTNAERGLFKIGFLTPLENNLYLDTAYHYMFILDKNIRETADELSEIGYLTVGIAYFWSPKK